MYLPIVVAHGVLGPYDEIILPVVGGAFIGLIIITWWTSRNKTPPDDLPADAVEPTGQDTPEESSEPSHYRLD